MSNFSGPDKTLLKLDSMEKEENFYVSENNQLVLLDGYYIYYEKNEEMQNYMVENKEEDTRVEAAYDDHATRKIRSIIKDKKEVKDDRNVIRLLYAASSLLAIIVLVIAATMLDNYDKMRNMESALNTISQTLSVANGEDPSTDETQETMSHGAENNTTKPEENGEENGDDLQSEDSDKLNVKEEDKKEDTTETSKEDKETSKVDTPVRYYTVEPGDSLAGISYKLYETYKYMDKIKELNGIEDEDMVYAGQKLIVP